jgi:hypothetical protein
MDKENKVNSTDKCGCTLTNPTVTISYCQSRCTQSWTAVNANHPFVPEAIHANESERIVVVKWEDGTETKVTCDPLDNFSVEIGFMAALTEHLFGGKKQFKSKWWKIISRRIHYHGEAMKGTPSKVVASKVVGTPGEVDPWDFPEALDKTHKAIKKATKKIGKDKK